jgi:hypothetical protein
LSQIACGQPRVKLLSALTGRCRCFHLRCRGLVVLVQSSVCYDVHDQHTMLRKSLVVSCLLAHASSGRVFKYYGKTFHLLCLFCIDSLNEHLASPDQGGLREITHCSSTTLSHQQSSVPSLKVSQNTKAKSVYITR